MATARGCRNVLSICALRIARVDSTGAPVRNSATGAWAVARGIGKLTYTPNILTGDDIAELDGCGGLAIVRKYPDRLKRFDLTLEMITESPEMHELLVGASLLTSGGAAVGYADVVDTNCGSTSISNTGCSIEAWSEQFACAVPFGQQYVRNVFPWAFMKPDARTLQKGPNHFLAKGFAVASSNFGAGPFNDLVPLVGVTTPHASLDDSALPSVGDGLCGYIATPAAT